MDLNTLLKHTSRSLYLSVKMLPHSIRPAFGLAYLLCRYADTIADTTLLPAQQRIHAILRFPQIVRSGKAPSTSEINSLLAGHTNNPYEKILLTHLPDCLQALKGISAQHKQFIYEVVEAVCEGMKIDLTQFPHIPHAAPHAFLLESDLTHYCRLMGGKPGLFWSQLIFHAGMTILPKETFYALGQQIGDSLQIVNILRDAPKDLQQGRCYFPQTDLEKATLTATDLLDERNGTKFHVIQKKWTHWGKQNLQSAADYYASIPKKHARVRAAVAWPMLWTADTFVKLSRTPDLLNPQKRVKISRLRVYATILVTPLLLISNTCFKKWLSHKLNKLP